MNKFLNRNSLIGFFLFSVSSFLHAQDSSFFVKSEKELCIIYSEILSEKPSNRDTSAKKFFNDFFRVIEFDSSFYYSFGKLEKIGKIYSSDQKLRIYSWNIPVNLDENIYFGIIQSYSKEQKKYKALKLTYNDIQEQTISINEWPGALYYQIIDTRYSGQRYYTLLGLNLNNSLSNKKVIDVMKINDSGEINFCQKTIEYKNKLVNRLVFEYNKKAIMTLHYDERKKMIVFDHLSPQKPSLEGNYQFYGPDFTYDGLKFEDGIWKYYANIVITN